MEDQRPKLSGPVGVELRNKTEDVYLVQWFLNNQGNSSPTHLAANGSFNPQTLKALQAYQKRNRLPPNGQVAVGSQTWKKLLALSTPPNWVRNRIKLGSANIQYSVGKNGKNHPEDVRTVQILLNKTGLSLKLKENGIADEKLYRAMQNSPINPDVGLRSIRFTVYAKHYDDGLNHGNYTGRGHKGQDLYPNPADSPYPPIDAIDAAARQHDIDYYNNNINYSLRRSNPKRLEIDRKFVNRVNAVDRDTLTLKQNIVVYVINILFGEYNPEISSTVP